MLHLYTVILLFMLGMTSVASVRTTETETPTILDRRDLGTRKTLVSSLLQLFWSDYARRLVKVDVLVVKLSAFVIAKPRVILV